MKATAVTTLFMLFTFFGIGQRHQFDYFGMTSPGEKTELFAPGIVSLKNSREGSLAISPNGDEVFFAGGPSWPRCKIMHVRKLNGQWTKPEVAEFSRDCYSTEPAFSPDGRYLYYSSSKGMPDIQQYCIWRIEKIGNRWGKAKRMIDIPNPGIWEFHPSITHDGTVYFCYWDSKTNKGSIYRSKYSAGTDSVPERINLSFDTQSSVTNPFVDPGDRYIITSSTGQYSKGGYDVFISYKKEDGSWSPPANFGDRFNTPGDDDSFDVSPDGRFLFIYKEDDVYWTETKGVFQQRYEEELNEL